MTHHNITKLSTYLRLRQRLLAHVAQTVVAHRLFAPASEYMWKMRLRQVTSIFIQRKYCARLISLSFFSVVATAFLSPEVWDSLLSKAVSSTSHEREFDPQTTWPEECKEKCCAKSLQVITQTRYAVPNLVCFEVSFGEDAKLRYAHLTGFNDVFTHYLSMARQFLLSASAFASFSGEVVWRIEDDATIDPSIQAIFTAARVATVGHSVHSERGDVNLYTVLTPNFHFIEHDGYSHLSKIAAASARPLETLQPKVFWAGSTTGQPCKDVEPCEKTCRSLQRYRLVRLSGKIDWLSCSLTKAIQWCNTDELELRNLGMFSDAADEIEWLQYRGVLDIDGNVDAWGARWRYATNSVVFKVESNYVSHYSHALIDGVHFIQISETLGDLEEKTAIIANNDSHTLSYLTNITRNARQTINQFTLQSAVEKTGRALKNFFSAK